MTIQEKRPRIIAPDQSVMVPLSRGAIAIVCERDYEKVAPFTWHLHPSTKANYAATKVRGRTMYMHQLIMPVKWPMTVDHRNGNGLDNRRENLRPATKREQARNRRIAPGGWPKGVYRRGKRRKQWNARIQLPDRRPGVYFASRTIAAIWYDRMARRHFGDFACTNFDRRIAPDEARRLIGLTAGSLFSVVFSRRGDGTERRMTCRTGVYAAAKDGRLAFDPRTRNLISVFDVRKNQYRFIPSERILCLRIKKIRYLVASPPSLN